MITSDIFIRCVITRAPTTKKHKEPNFPGWQRAVPAYQPGATGVWGVGWAPEVGDLSKTQL